jgi:hypothetical protein
MLNSSTKTSTRRSIGRLLLVGAAITGVSACKGLTSVSASFDNVTEALTVYPINGSPPGAPTALSLFAGSPSHADQAFAYDFAFDLDTSGRVVLIPARQLATQLSSPYSVGLQVVPGSFAALDRAPKSGYTVDSLLVIEAHMVVAIESHDVARCQFAIKGQSYFSKLIVDSINLELRKISATVTVNRNCGFTSFADGRPQD